MSEHPSEAAVFNSLRNMEAILEDPLVTRVVNKARQYSNHIQTEHDPKVIALMVEDLDTDWVMFKKMPALCSGIITYDTPDGVAVVEYVEELAVISNGFTFSDTLDPRSNQRKRRIRHHFYIPADALTADYGDESLVQGMAELDDISMNPESYSLERARAWLNEEHPGLIDQLDAAVAQEPRSSKRERFMALKKVSFSESLVERVHSAESIRRYLSELFPIDRELPYILRVDGHYTQLPQSEHETVCHGHGTLIVDIHHFDIGLRDPMDARSGIGVDLSVDIHPPLQGSELIAATIPLHAVQNAQALRKKYYPESV